MRASSLVPGAERRPRAKRQGAGFAAESPVFVFFTEAVVVSLLVNEPGSRGADGGPGRRYITCFVTFDLLSSGHQTTSCHLIN